MHAAAAEAGDLARGVQARERLPVGPSTRESRSVWMPPSVLRVRMLRRTAISGPWSGSRNGAAWRPGSACRSRERRALAIAISCRSLENALASSRSRATICALDRRRRRAAGRGRCAFIPSTSSSRVSATTKSSPCSLNASTGPGAPLARRLVQQELQVLAGDVGVLLGAGERELLLDDRLGQHEPRVVVAGRQDRLHRADACRSPGSRARAAGCRCASSHSDDGPGMIRIAWSGQIGSQLWMPSV